MKNRKGLAFLLLLVLAVLFGVLYVYERSQNARLWAEVNQDEANQFFPALDYLQELEPRLNGAPLTKEDLQAERGSLSRTAVSLQEVLGSRSRLLKEPEVKTANLIDFLMRTDRQISAMIDAGGPDPSTVKEISRSLQKINAVSRQVYRFESGLTTEQWETVNEIGFMQDERLAEWYMEVENALSP